MSIKAASPAAGSGPPPRPTWRRYLVLFLFCLNSGNKAFQWIQIPAASTKLAHFYAIDNFVINAIAVIFMVSFVFLSLPACLVIRWMGMRRVFLLSSLGATLGSVIKCFSCHQGGIYLLMLGQVVVSMSEQLIFSLPSRLVAVWFPDHQVSSALAITFVGNQLGVALGFFLPQYLLNGATSEQEIGQAMESLFVWTAIVSLVALLADLVFFDEAPPHPPGLARCKQLQEEQRQGATCLAGEARAIKRHLSQLLANPDYRLLTLYYGINVGVIYTVSSLLNQTFELTWPGDDILVGNTGFLIILGGCLSAPLWGRLLDKCHRYLLLNVLPSGLGLVALAALGTLTCQPNSSHLLIYLAATLVGVFQCGVTVNGLELAVELTYPAPELLTSTLMNLTPQVFATCFIFLGSYIVDTHGVLAINLFYALTLAADLLLLLGVRERLGRQAAVVDGAQAAAATGQLQVRTSSSTGNKELEQVC